jgi:hypothetical protein
MEKAEGPFEPAIDDFYGKIKPKLSDFYIV